MAVTWTIYLTLVVFSSGINANNDTCEFPSVLWETENENEHRVWYADMLYLDSSPNWHSRVQVVTKRDHITIASQYHGLCGNSPSTVHNCIKTQTSNILHCRRKMEDNTFIVERSGDGNVKFKCLKFALRSKNVVQVSFSAASDALESQQCETNLRRREGPWIADVPTDLQPFPLVGGFDFQAYASGKKRKVCPKVWRPSRLESECIHGDGLVIMFPEKHCSFLHDLRLEIRMQNWGSWEEKGYTFVVAGETDKPPQFVLRIDKNRKGTIVHLFLSPACPLQKESGLHGNILAYKLVLRRSESGICVDESEQCERFADEGKCSSSELYQYANFCKRSCGMCGLVASGRPECDFPLRFHGRWLQFDEAKRDTIQIGSGRMTFANKGEFICKAKHWNFDLYKFLSVFNNGCRPRYTCFSLSLEPDHHYLQLQMSSSERIDNSWALCAFNHKPASILHSTSLITADSCGIDGFLRVQASLSHQTSCDATLTDINPITCTPSNKLQLTYQQCKPHPAAAAARRVFTCEGYRDIGSDFRLLFTKESRENSQPDYSCWLVEMDTSSAHSEWRRAYILQESQCSHAAYEHLMDPEIYKPLDVTFQFRKRDEPTCLKMTNSGGNVAFTVTGGNTRHRNAVSEKLLNSAQTILPQLVVNLMATLTIAAYLFL